jgi:hypothetical protein
MITHVCPHCDSNLRTQDALGGLTAACPECRQPIEIPLPATDHNTSQEAPGNLVAQSEAVPSTKAPTARTLLILLCQAILFVLVCATAWFLPMSFWVWFYATLVVGLILICCGIGLVSQWSILGLEARLWHLLAVGMCAAWLYISYSFAPVDVFVDNYSTQNVRLELNGEEWLALESASSEITTLRKGKHELVVRQRAGGKELDRMIIDVDGFGPFVLNVLGAMTYYKGTKTYVTPGAAAPSLRNQVSERIDKKWFAPNVDYCLSPVPESVLGRGWEAKTFLRRVQRAD